MQVDERSEPGDIETLDLRVADCHPHNVDEYIRIGVLEADATGPNGTVSFVLVQFNNQHECKFCQSHINVLEIDAIISGLKKAKQRMEEYNSKKVEVNA